MTSLNDVCLSVCTRCRPADFPGAETERPGYLLASRVVAEARGVQEALPGLSVRGIRCMSQCKRPCAVAFSAPAKFTLLFGDLAPESDVEAILHLAGQYAQSADGLIPRADRPACLRSGILGRVPPLGYADEMLDRTFTLPSKPV
ncbi:DUF1636 domain-containing protein [Roseobacter sp. HKCCD9010]|uniref:DUF1636 family protein n=1 Tax=unclassified Roseobacter TaxID=196798 RepID=UPI0014916E62|nr:MULTISPECIES: DUF1636 domain-containing protein [unclassified Roseobacter]MBF9052495.1 DUF1636 domain-containing protein [Rhodobacterales bacterium HKCCD4356]NNV14065.1 DUF1636 domain-containing protein [Roseobacter sp. HKCCD7357]NNV18688.1 DUF1636 domain-containing protein [Roseobacter sp. HKCCD8768]NNV28152.1 DUF1636 domain-containing protein [Roseobacter sp. HKCCD8192]NNV32432.1 DUF1636 domain-containing protein [Roseobacter sp. HKCCD9061]